MRTSITPTFAAFRDRARLLLEGDVAPSDVLWDDGSGQRALLGEVSASPARAPNAIAIKRTVPAAFLRDAELAALHSDPARWDVLYRIAFRLTHGEPELLEVAGDVDVARFRTMVRAIRHDEHRMHAFLRFRETPDGYVAWYEPEHDIAALAATHFVKRFPSMHWVILTPKRTVAWNGAELRVSEGASRVDAPSADELDDLFRAYYGAIFNPARTNLEAFGRHVPSRFRQNMPETATVRELVRDAPRRMTAMSSKKTSPSLVFVPSDADQGSLVRASRACAACDLYKDATQVVFGAGPAPAALMLVGEQPGDEEDLRGKPFVGPAGRVLDAALERAGIRRDEIYVTNAVKHFKWEPRGKRRIHSKPNAVEVHACNGWLQAEISLVKPDLIVCLGATAAQSFFGRAFSITKNRGEVRDGAPWAPHILATYHPSALLRMTGDEAAYARAKQDFERDLETAARMTSFRPLHDACEATAKNPSAPARSVR